MDRKKFALAAVLTLSMLGTSALAVEDGAGPARSTAQPIMTAGALMVGSVPQGGTPTGPSSSHVPAPEGSITFDDLERRMRENDLSLLMLEENIRVIQSFDYDEMTEDLRQGLNAIASAQWQLISAGSMVQIPNPGSDPMVGGINQALSASMSMSTASTNQQLQTQYNAMRDTFDDLKSGKFQADNEDLIWQLENAQDQVVMAGESLYIALTTMEQNGQAISRGLDTLDRTLTELSLRHELGQISTNTLEQAQASRTSLVSSQETLNSTIQTYKMQLEMLTGEPLTGSIQLGGLPQVTSEQIQDMDLDRGLADAKRASYSLYEAKQTLDDAQKDFKDAGSKYGHNDKNYEYVQARHQWQAAQHNYEATVQNFEMGLRTLYLKVKDNDQVLKAAKEALSVEQNNYAVAQLKFSQGSLSKNGLLEAEDKVKQAQEAVDSAAVELFSSYNSYRWAVDHGILNT